MKTPAHNLKLLAFLIALLSCVAARAAELDDMGFGLGDTKEDERLEAFAKLGQKDDLLKLSDSVLLERTLGPGKWDAPGPEAKLMVPSAGSHKVWVRHRLGFARQMAFKVAYTTGGRTGEATLGKYTPDSAMLGKTLEKKYPFHLDQEKDRIGTAPPGAAIWESFDAKLDKGVLALRIEPIRNRRLPAPTAVDRVFITRSKSYRPQDDHFRQTWLRFRLVESTPRNMAVAMTVGTTYHAQYYKKRGAMGLWYSSFGGMDKGGKPVPAGEWSDWLEITEYLLNGSSFVTGWMQLRPAPRHYKVEVQMAWRPLPGAALKTVSTPGRALLVPVKRTPPGSTAEVPVGVRDPDWMARFETAEDVARRHESWIEEAALPDMPTPKKVRAFSGCGVAPEREMLRKLGINDFDSFRGLNDALFYAGSHCPNDPKIKEGMDRIVSRAEPYGRTDRTRLWKLGDEIGCIVGNAHVAGCSDCMARYHALVKAAGYTAADFGLASLEDLPYGSLPGAADSRAARLVRQLSTDFAIANSATFYKHYTEAINRRFPRDLTAVNYTPHSDLMFSTGMHRIPWFSLCRAKATTMGWGEGWLSGGSWGFGGMQTISYFAAIVEAEGRPFNMPWGFYCVMSTGTPDLKLLSLFARGAEIVNIYTFGPAYAGAEMSNFWSERKDVYKPIGMVLRTVGAADDLMAAGRPPRAQVGVLYNLTHERWQQDGAVTYDRRELYMALLHAHVTADIVTEDDLNPDALKQYKVLYLTGENLSAAHVQAVKDWVSAGGTLWAHGGVGTRNALDSLSHAMDDVFGCRQLFRRRIRTGYHPDGLHRIEPIDTLAFKDNEFFTARNIPVMAYKVALRPTTATVIGAYPDGTPGAVVNRFGKGRAILIGTLGGLAYRRGAPEGKRPFNTYRELERAVVTDPALKSGVARPATCTEPLVEVQVLASEKGWAVTLINFKYEDLPALTLRVHTDRAFTRAHGSLKGDLPLKPVDGGYEVTLPLGFGDVVAFR